MPQPGPVSLVRLAPEPECPRGPALKLAADLADLLNFDEGLPESIRPGIPEPLETAESVLSFTRDWCLTRNALFHAIVLDGATAIGSISLSHIDLSTRSARSGYWLGSRYQGRGYGTKALAGLIAIAREKGIQRLSAMVPQGASASGRMWEKLGARLRVEDGGASVTVELD